MGKKYRFKPSSDWWLSKIKHIFLLLLLSWGCFNCIVTILQSLKVKMNIGYLLLLLLLALLFLLCAMAIFDFVREILFNRFLYVEVKPKQIKIKKKNGFVPVFLFFVIII